MTPAGAYSEAGLVEEPALELLAELGWDIVNAFHEEFGPAGTLGRDSMPRSSSSTACATPCRT